MYLDLHSHSVSSDDSRATVEQFAKWVNVLRRKGCRIDGFALTEHRKFDFDKDYSALARDQQVVILKAAELDTDHGHFLVYGATEALTDRIDFSEVGLDALELIRATQECGAIAVPAHPGRFGIGLYEFIQNGAELGSIRVVERLNGGDRPGELKRAEELIGTHRYLGTGGSDAHVVSAVGRCLTHFQESIADERDLVRELKAGRFHAVTLDETSQH